MTVLHDHTLVGYTVDGEGRSIELRTKEGATALFEGVEAYSFRYDCFGNILLDLHERRLVEAIEEHWSELEAGFRQSGWPRFWQGDEAKTREVIAAMVVQGVKWFDLDSSYGMNGWLICRKMRIGVRE
jgi:hypothetical protein